MNNERIIVVAGPTAAGKSALAVELALMLGAEIVSADAFQIYRGLPILTAQPSPDDMMRVRHHLVAMLAPGEEFSAAEFARRAEAIIAEIQQRNQMVVVVGGSGFYLGALFGGMAVAPPPAPGLREQLALLSLDELIRHLTEKDPQAAQQIDLKNPRRLQRALEIVLTTGQPFATFAPRKTEWPRGIVLMPDREELRQRIDERAAWMLTNGAIEEVANVGKTSTTCAQIIGLQDIRKLLGGEIGEAECQRRLSAATWQYARRQLTWFRHQTTWEQMNLAEAHHYFSALQSSCFPLASRDFNP